MQANEILKNLRRVDDYVKKNFLSLIEGSQFELKIIGKSALLLGGLEDSVGTVDIDTLGIDREMSLEHSKILEELTVEFGKGNLKRHDFYLESVAPAIVFLSQRQKWIQPEAKFVSLSVVYLDPHHVAASKLFSAFSDPRRKKDKQDIIASLDQGKVDFQTLLMIADELFDFYSMDARSSRFPEVYRYIASDLMSQYGPGLLKFCPEEP